MQTNYFGGETKSGVRLYAEKFLSFSFPGLYLKVRF